MKCPVCRLAMNEHDWGRTHGYMCQFCSGTWFDGDKNLSLLGINVKKQKIKNIHIQCPKCNESLYKVSSEKDYKRIAGHICQKCHGVFLNKVDFRLLKKYKKTKPKPEKTERDTDRYYNKYEEDRSMEAKEYLFNLLFGLPIEINLPPRKVPIATYSLIFINVLIYFMIGINQAIAVTWGVTPANAVWYTFITSMFLHGSLFHLLGNMYFLWIFGDNVEDRLGTWRYLLLYFATGILGDFAYIMIEAGSSMPAIGASGAISGVLGAYLLACPKAKIGIVFFFIPIRFSIFGYLVLWVGIQILISFTASNIGWHAHLGGFFSGILLYLFLKNYQSGLEE